MRPSSNVSLIQPRPAGSPQKAATSASASAAAAPAAAASPASSALSSKQLLTWFEEGSALDAASTQAVQSMHSSSAGRHADADSKESEEKQARRAPAHTHTAPDRLSLLDQLAQREASVTTAGATASSARAPAAVVDLSLFDTRPYPFAAAAVSAPSPLSHSSVLALLLSAQLYSTTPASLQHITHKQASGPERTLIQAGFRVTDTADAAHARRATPLADRAAQHQRHLLYYLQLRSTAASLQSLLSSSATLLSSSSSLLSLFGAVFSKTNSVREECSALLAEQQALAADTLKFNYHLSYFVELESMQAKLSDETAQPVLARFMREHSDGHAFASDGHTLRAGGVGLNAQAGSAVLAQQQLHALNPMLSAEFPHILSTLDSCLDYMHANQTFLDAPSARAKYEKLHAAILRACRNYVRNSMDIAIRIGTEDAAQADPAEAHPKPAAGTSPSDSTSVVGLYQSTGRRMKVFVQLRASAHSLRPLVLELEHRAFVNEGGIFGAGYQSPIAPAAASDASSSSSAGSAAANGAAGVVSAQPSYYRELLLDCYRIYSEKRHALLFADLSSHLNSLLSSGRSLSSLIRSACLSWIEVCLLESQLFLEFFSPNSHSLATLNDLLAAFCSLLYTALRPRIIANLDMDALAEVITILQIEIVQEQVRARGNVRAPAKAWTATAGGAMPAAVDAFHPSSPLYAFSKSIQRLIADVQERLIYRAQLYIRDAIQNYKSAADDLNYPAKLTATNKMAAAPQQTSDASMMSDPATAKSADAALTPGSPRRDIVFLWHPVLERTLMFLSKLYRCVEASVFKYLASEAVGVCTNALIDCSHRITAAHASLPDASLSDGLLFLIKHLLMLREQISPFSSIDFSLTSTDLDFSHMRDVLPTIFSSVGKWSSFVELVGTSAPRVKEHRTDSKKNMEAALKLACEQFIASQTQCMIGPLLEFFTKMGATQQSGEAAHAPAQFKAELISIVARMVGRQPTANGEAEQSGSLGASLAPRTCPFALQLGGVLRHTSLYLSNAATERVLFKPIQRTLTEVFQQLTFFVHTHFPRGEASGAASASASAGPVTMSADDALTLYLEESIAELEQVVRQLFQE